MTYRNTYSEVKINNLKDNVSKIINNYDGYKYYIGVVKADCYEHNTNTTVKAIIDGGCNYLAVSSLDEAMTIRQAFDTPILCLGIIDSKYMDVCEKNHIDVAVTSLAYVKQIKDYNLNIHIKIDTGMNRLGVKSKEEFNNIVNEINNSNLHLQGIFTHIYDAENSEHTMNQINRFKDITSDIDLSSVPMVHIAQSDTLLNYPKIDFVNGCRLGIIMYGLVPNNLDLKNTINLCSEIIDIKKLYKGETVSYGGNYKASEDELIGIVSVGYADGVNRKLTGSYVYVNDKKCQILGNVCMDMIMIRVDDTMNIHDKVYIYKDNEHIMELSKYIDTIPYELICNISKRVPRIYE